MNSNRKAAAVLMSLCATIIAPLTHAQSPAPQVAEQVLQDSRAIASSLAARLESDFVYPDVGKRYAAGIRDHANAGRYDALRGLDLAKRLTDDLQAIAADGHLRVGFGGGHAPKLVIEPAGAANGAMPSSPPGAVPKMIRMPPPPPVEQARWLAPGIAFVRFNLFPDDPDVTQAAAKFMADHASAKTIIFDLRNHRGGGLEQMDVIFPWLFAKPTRLVTMATRKSVDEADGSPVAGVQSLRLVAGNPDFVTREHWVTPGKDKRLSKAKIFVLISNRTGSAAEHFALALKSTKRATLIGVPTYGANHFGGDQDLGGTFTAFIPVGRTYDPLSGKDWEGSGVQPDIDTPPEDALLKALLLSGIGAHEAARLSAEVAPKTPMVRRIP